MQNINNSLLGKIIYPECFAKDSNCIKAYNGLNDELKELVEISGYKSIFSKKYNKALRFLENLKTHCTEQEKLFELLIGEEGLYSMRLKGEKNIRVLFCFSQINNIQVAILLNCFEEKSKKDYAKAIKIANVRRKELGIVYS